MRACATSEIPCSLEGGASATERESGLHSQVKESRFELVDFLRGFAIVEMLAAHYATFLPHVAQRFIGYSETAMALFVLLAGLMVGWSYQKFARSPRSESWVMWRRALRVLAVQYLMILTLGVPFQLLGLPGARSGQPLSTFVLQSMLLLNQISLLHILPTFIPLFAMSPAVLYALARSWDVGLLLVSLALFCLGHFSPHLLDLGGEPTIFPFILFQLYFVVGCLLGKRTRLTGRLPPRQPQKWLVASCGLVIATLLLVHGRVVPSGLISTHPLNLVGLAYHVPIIATVWLGSMVFAPTIERLWVYPYITRFGRHALLVFVIHVYLAKALSALNHLTTPPAWLNLVLIAASVVVMNALVRRYELSRAREPPPLWTAGLGGLFK